MLGMVAKKRQSQNSRLQSLPAPVGGWNKRDSIANMDEKDAVTMENWFPGTGDVMVRKGWTLHRDAYPAEVESLLVYNGSTTSEMFAVSSGNIYDASVSASSAGATEVSGLTNSRWKEINITTSGGNFMYAANGVDEPLLYDGSAWTAITAVSTPAILGVTTTTLRNPSLFKNRVWFVEDNTLKAWYLPVDSVGGTAAALDLSAVARRGGELTDIGTWTIDAGEGVDDYWVGITSQGEVIVYKGTDPSSSSTWALVGVWHVGSPIGNRPFLKFGGDLLIVCVDGVLPLSKALLSARVDARVALTDKIQGAMSEYAASYSSNFGWQLLFYPAGDMVLLNIPVQEGNEQEQFAMNTITGAWGQFTGISANCWALFNDQPYFGGSDYVGQFWNTFADNDEDINADVQQAFSYFKDRGSAKMFKMVRPIIQSNGSPALLAALNVDYTTDSPTNTLNFAPTTYAVWDTALWDSGIWGGALATLKSWQTFGRIGVSAAMRLLVQQQGIETHWAATDFIYEPGGYIG